MAIAYVKEVLHVAEDTILDGNSAADFVVGLGSASAPSAGNTVVVFWSGRVSVTALAPTVTDSKGNTYAVRWVSNGTTVSLIAATDQAAGTLTTADTITVHSGNGNGWTAYTLKIEEFSGLASPLAVDVSTTGTGSSTSASTGTTAATAQADELALAMCATQGNRTISKDAAYTSPTTGAQVVTTGTAVSGFGTYKILAATGTQTATYTFTSAIWAAVLFTVKAASGTPTVSPSGVASAEAFGSASLRRVLAPAGAATGEAIGQSRVARILAAVGIGSGQTFGVAGVLRLLSPTAIAPVGTFGIPTLAPHVALNPTDSNVLVGDTPLGTVTLTDALIASAIVTDRLLEQASSGNAPLAAVNVSDTLADSVSVSES